jgi:hemolysin III
LIPYRWKRPRAIEELANVLTHGLGLVLSVVGFVFLLVFAIEERSWLHVASATVYGVTLMALYAASTAYHSTGKVRRKQMLRRVDHVAIYLLIAELRGGLGWTVCAAVWAAAIGGVCLKVFRSFSSSWLSTASYLVMGWMSVLIIKPLWDTLPPLGFVLLVSGGLAYTAGTWFFANGHRPLYHAIWHLFVLAGSALHFAAILFFVIRS